MSRVTREQLVQENRRLSEDSTVLHLALNDVLNGRVTWFEIRSVAIGISRETEAHGGIVMVRGDGYVSAYYWEGWFAEVRENLSPIPEVIRLRVLAFKVHEHVLRVQSGMRSAA